MIPTACDAAPEEPSRVLVVDDVEAIRTVTALMLRDAGYRVLEAETGLEALRQAQTLPDLIVLDVHLPDVDGVEVARRLKADPRTERIPILHLTGTYRELGDKVRGLETADGYLTKPVEAAELTATVRALLRARRAELRLRASETRRRVAEALVEVGTAITAPLPLQTVLDLVAEQAGALLGTDRTAVILVDPAGSAGLRVVAHRGMSAPLLDPERPAHGLGGVAAGAIAQGAPAWSADLAQGPAFALTPETRATLVDAGVRSVLAVPLRVEARILGALVIGRATAGPFAPDEVRLLEAFGAQVAIAIEHARLYQAIRESHETLTRTQAQLTQAQKMEAIGQLAGGIAHDFNNLVTVIQGRSEVLMNALAADPHLAKQTRAIQTAAERAATLTRQLLAFSRKQVMAPRVLDLGALVTGMEDMLRRLIREDIVLTTVSAAQGGRVRADPGQIEQVVMNLVINARDAMPQAGQIRIETAAVDLDEAFARANPGAQPGAYVKLAVCDTGEGMSAETQARCFEPFFTTKGPGQGTGLGLATVYGIVKQHEGYVQVESALGRGTTVTMYLPRLPARVALDRPTPKSDATPRGSETVLLVEDEAEVRGVTREMLESLGYTVVATGEPAEAIALVEGSPRPVRLLITDVVMPEVSGPDLARQLAARWPDLRVLYVSGYTVDAIVHHGVLEPGVILLAKPFTRATLAQKVREALA